LKPIPDDCSGIARTRRVPRCSIRLAILVVGVLAALAPATAQAAFLSPGLAHDAQARPDATFNVIIQGEGNSDAVAAEVKAMRTDIPGLAVGVKKKFSSITGVAAELTGKQILKLADKKGILAITEDGPMMSSGLVLSNDQRWPYASGDAKFWPLGAKIGVQAPTIAIVDSGIDAGRLDFGGRVIQQVDLTSLPGGNSPGDGRGHGTMVASIAAGSAPNYAGAATDANLVSLDVFNDDGAGVMSDVIAAADWILKNKGVYGIRVANFSLHASYPSTFRFDPLDKAVEKLWFSGVVVVAASGNYGAVQSGVLYAPANDPFVITVGADDIGGSVAAKDDFVAPWSAYGYTLDGFAKPELGAPGRYMVGAVPPNSALALERPDRIVEPGYMQMSGTSFAAPVVSGAAAYLLTVHPDWTPDQVKGALMMTARATPLAAPLSNGAGEVWAPAAAGVGAPPNPNLALDQFLIADPAGASVPVFDEATWTSAARSNPAWDAATWTSATWTSATWTSATWTSNSWEAATWTSATWTSATWTSATWTSATWTSGISNDATWTAAAANEGLSVGGDWIATDELLAAELELGLTTAP
jgi:serine protease AprX